MASIDISIVGDLLTATVTGDLTADDVLAVVNEYYPSGIVKNVIWDLSNGSMKNITRDGFLKIAKAAKIAAAVEARRGGRTAYVARGHSAFGLSRMYMVIAELEGVPVEYDVYKTLEEARNWIQQAS